MFKTINNTMFGIILFTMFSCQNPAQTHQEKDQNPPATTIQKKLDGNVLTAEAQSKLTPDIVLATLKEGNTRYINNTLTPRDYVMQAEKTAKGQYPMAVILSCIDSRVPVEEVFDLGIGDVFVARVAGNFVNEDILGSMEYGCKVSGSKLIVVMGHESCGAIKAAIDNVELGNITEMLEKIKPAVELSQDFEGEKTTANYAYVDYVVELNVKLAIENIRQQSPILKQMEDLGEIKIVGAFYDLHKGKVEFLYF